MSSLITQVHLRLLALLTCCSLVSHIEPADRGLEPRSPPRHEVLVEAHSTRS